MVLEVPFHYQEKGTESDLIPSPRKPFVEEKINIYNRRTEN